MLTFVPHETVNDFAASHRFRRRPVGSGARGRDRGGAAAWIWPPVARGARSCTSKHETAYRVSNRVGQVTGGPGHRQDGDRAARAALLAETSGKTQDPRRPVLLTNVQRQPGRNHSKPSSTADPRRAVRDRIELLNVDLLAYRVVKQRPRQAGPADEREGEFAGRGRRGRRPSTSQRRC